MLDLLDLAFRDEGSAVAFLHLGLQLLFVLLAAADFPLYLVEFLLFLEVLVFGLLLDLVSLRLVHGVVDRWQRELRPPGAANVLELLCHLRLILHDLGLVLVKL